MRSAGRGKLPTCVVRMRSVLRCIRSRLNGRAQRTRDRRHGAASPLCGTPSLTGSSRDAQLSRRQANLKTEVLSRSPATRAENRFVGRASRLGLVVRSSGRTTVLLAALLTLLALADGILHFSL